MSLNHCQVHIADLFYEETMDFDKTSYCRCSVCYDLETVLVFFKYSITHHNLFLDISEFISRLPTGRAHGTPASGRQLIVAKARSELVIDTHILNPCRISNME